MTRPVVAIVTGSNDYQLRLLRSTLGPLERHGIPLIAHTNDMLRREAVFSSLDRLLRDVDPLGVIRSGALGPDDEQRLSVLLASRRAPVVNVGFDTPGVTAVYGDNTAGMRALMTHLLDEVGVRRPVLIRGIRHQPDSVVREQVFREEMRRRDLDVDEDLVIDGRFSFDVALGATEALLARRRDLDAVVALNDPAALGALTALEDAGLRVPEDVAVTGFDNDEAAHHWPGLTTVDQDLEGQGGLAATLLLEQVAGGPVRGNVVSPSRLVVRGSTDPRRREDLSGALEITTTGMELLHAQDSVIGMNRALTRSRSLDDLARELAIRLDWIGVPRCFLVLHEGVEVDSGGPVRQQPRTPAAGTRGRLVFAYRGRQSYTSPGQVYDSRGLLPAEFRHELDRGLLVLQPLSMLDRDLGFLLFEPAPGIAAHTEGLRLDLGRILDGLLSARALEEHTARLERTVRLRTEKLELEAATRRRAEEALHEANLALERSLRVDGLTGIANRVAFDQHLERHWQAHRDDGATMALLMIDIDLFKAYNDRYGHVYGDDTLRAVAACLQRAVHDPDDLACRYGGEEFAVVLPRNGITAAMAVAGRFRELLAETAIPHGASPVAPVVTASIGAAAVTPAPGQAPSVLVELADEALYRAKTGGRDRVVARQ
ncbi:MAG: GGDEF domain-containing protein [Actinomycetales bacterium]|nr:GGDEF domain-containing protein [Actinomycetales bacterium]